MFTGAFLATLLPVAASSAIASFKDSPKAVVDEVWQIVNRDIQSVGLAENSDGTAQT
jgi:carboxyl-terminal processing protease